jgi:ATP-dependent helicase/nuclease subunit A
MATMPELTPIVAQLGLSRSQAEAVMARGCAVAVTAGAGAGKTRTLVARYLSLLAEGMPPRSVVAITFTRKAAREMRNRVRAQVRHFLDESGLEGAERARWQEAYRQLDAARIGTIHSLCGEILRHHPAEAGLDPRFEMLDEGQSALLQAEAVDATMAWAVDDTGAAGLYTLFGEQVLRETLSRLLAQRLDAGEAFAVLPQDAAGLRAYWAEAVAESRRAAIEALLGDVGFMEAVALLRAAQPLREDDKLVVQVREVVGAVEVAYGCCEEGAPTQPPALTGICDPTGEGQEWAYGCRDERAPTWPPALTGICDPQGEGQEAAAALAVLDGIRLNVGSYRAWPGGKVELAEVKDALRVLREAWRGAAEWVSLALTEADEALMACYPALRALYQQACAGYAALKKQRPALDFDDLEAGALRLLRTDPAVRAYWQGEIRALLVDEFQDTNGRQRDLLDLIDGGVGKLFLVGDGKQSIYRFRGADVTVFRQKRAQVAAEGRAIDLATSYRAHRALIEALNGLLGPVLGEADTERPYVEPFAPLAHHREAPAKGLPAALRPVAAARAPAYVEVHVALGTKRGGALERAATALVGRLVELVEGGGVCVQETDPDEGQQVERPLDYGDIAILCRASSAFPAYEDALEAAGVPFLTVAGRGFYDRGEIRDVLNALRAIADPTDDLALAGLLRSAGCRLTDMALYRLVEVRRAQDAPSLWTVLEGSAVPALAEEAGLAREAAGWIGGLHEQVGRVPVADVLKAYLDRSGYRAALLQAGQGRAARNVAKLLSDAHASEIVGVDAFLQYVAQLRDVGAREGEAYSVGSGAVQVMSVHAAKGLEFRVVAIGDAGRQEPRTHGLLVDSQLGVLPQLEVEASEEDERIPGPGQVVRSAAYRLAQQRAQDQERAESDRLLYVAATRAQELLLINGAVGSKLDGWLGRLDQALPLSEWLSEGGGQEEAIRSALLDAGGAPVSCTLYPEEAVLFAWQAQSPPGQPVALPEELPLLRSLVPEVVTTDAEAAAQQRDPPRRAWRVVPDSERVWAPSWIVGEIVHRALERWAFPGGKGRAFEGWAEAEARRCGLVDAGEIDDAARRAARIVFRFQATELYAEMDAAAVRMHEVPYSVCDEEGRVEHGVIDALYRDDRGWALVEFKTDRIRSAAMLEERLASADYVPQVARYVAAAERQLGEQPRAALCLLDCQGTVRVVKGRW